MPKPLRPQDVAIMREALEYQAEPLDAETLVLMLSNNISDPLSEEQKQAETLLQKSVHSSPSLKPVCFCLTRIKRSSLFLSNVLSRSMLKCSKPKSALNASVITRNQFGKQPSASLGLHSLADLLTHSLRRTPPAPIRCHLVQSPVLRDFFYVVHLVLPYFCCSVRNCSAPIIISFRRISAQEHMQYSSVLRRSITVFSISGGRLTDKRFIFGSLLSI